ncbi:MAG TPA: hypothetical protein PLX65_00275, partial [Accumulibacter sp.]|nr:hypothetical protein [Accumulibacter sp.]
MRQPQENEFTTHDGSTLFYRCWPAVDGHGGHKGPDGGSDSGGRSGLLLHRGHEHSGRLQHVVDEL